MAAIRIFVVDDSTVIRRTLCDTLAEDPALEVAGSAADGASALAKLPLVNPDVVTLDIEMPVMNGLDALREIRKRQPKLPVIMFSTMSERGAAATLDALALGASDYATKPSAGSLDEARAMVRNGLIPKIKALCLRAPRTILAPKNGNAATGRRRGQHRIEIVAVGTSTGGPNALAELGPQIPADFPAPIVIVQHMPALFTRMLAERLAGRCQISVSEGREGAPLEARHAWIAPGDFHMTVTRGLGGGRISLNQRPHENSCRPSVDALFRSAAEAYGAGVLGVVMTGMGADGVKGAQQIREAGGEVIVQDEATSVVWGMPGMVYAAGQADGVYPLGLLGGEITRRVMESRGAGGMARKVEMTTS